MFKPFIATLIAITVTGCATVTPGPGDAAASARKISPSADATAVYFCRDWGYAGSGISLYPLVNGRPVATLQTKTFTRVDLKPGKYEIALGYYDKDDSGLFKAMQRDPVKMEVIDAKAGEIYHYWIGVAGSSFFGGSLTIDHFDNNAQAIACVDNATYVSPRQANITQASVN